MFDSQTPGPQSFDDLFRDSDDPWRFKTRWYEARKRALTLACLPAARYAYGYEPGCANGELSAELAMRCDRLLVSDVCERAVELARARLTAWTHARVIQAQLPRDWPVLGANSPGRRVAQSNQQLVLVKIVPPWFIHAAACSTKLQSRMRKRRAAVIESCHAAIND